MIIITGGRRPQDAALCAALFGPNVEDPGAWCSQVATHYVEAITFRENRREAVTGRLCARHTATVIMSPEHDFFTVTPLRRTS